MSRRRRWGPYGGYGDDHQQEPQAHYTKEEEKRPRKRKGRVAVPDAILSGVGHLVDERLISEALGLREFEGIKDSDSFLQAYCKFMAPHAKRLLSTTHYNEVTPWMLDALSFIRNGVTHWSLEVHTLITASMTQGRYWYAGPDFRESLRVPTDDDGEEVCALFGARCILATPPEKRDARVMALYLQPSGWSYSFFQRLLERCKDLPTDDVESVFRFVFSNMPSPRDHLIREPFSYSLNGDKLREWAFRYKSPRLLELMLEYGLYDSTAGTTMDPLMGSARNAFGVQLLLQEGKSVDDLFPIVSNHYFRNDPGYELDERSWTPLYIAEDYDVACALLECGANPSMLVRPLLWLPSAQVLRNVLCARPQFKEILTSAHLLLKRDPPGAEPLRKLTRYQPRVVFPKTAGDFDELGYVGLLREFGYAPQREEIETALASSEKCACALLSHGLVTYEAVRKQWPSLEKTKGFSLSWFRWCPATHRFFLARKAGAGQVITKRVKTALLCLRRVCPALPRDVRIRVLMEAIRNQQ